MFRLRAQQKGLSLDFTQGSDVPQFIRTDQSKLRQILINLLGNAVKFTETGGITLSVTNGKPDSQAHTNDCFLHFEVIDTGMGVVKQEQDKIFDAFFQTDTHTSSQQGTGLGLPISRKFAELMDGVLTVHSNGVTGSNFTFDLPVEIAAHADSDTESSLANHKVIGIEPGQPEIRLLVVEDNDNNRNLLVKLLQSVGLTVQEAVNGRDAIELWEKWQPHLIWMDMRMPVMDGYQATSHIKTSTEGKDTVIIALTASAFKKDRLKVKEHGGDDFISKPFREAEIFAMLAKHLGGKFIFDDESAGSIELGSWCNISARCRIYTHDHIHLGCEPLLAVEEEHGIIWQDKKIGSDVWVHDGAIVLYQVTHIPDGVVIGAGSVLTKNPGAYEIWAGNPARKIGKREEVTEEEIQKLTQVRGFCLGE